MITSLLLAVVVLTFASFASQTVHVSITEASSTTMAATWTGTSYSPYLMTKTLMQSPYLMQGAATIPYSQTLYYTQYYTETTSLSDAVFGALSILMIGILAFMTTCAALKSKHTHGSKWATTWQFIKSSDSVVRCESELSPASAFCNKSGTKHPWFTRLSHFMNSRRLVKSR